MMDLCRIIPSSFVWHRCAAVIDKRRHRCVINQSKFAANEMKNEPQRTLKYVKNGKQKTMKIKRERKKNHSSPGNATKYEYRDYNFMHIRNLW